MGLDITKGLRQRREGTFQSQETLTQSTATAVQTLSLTTDVSVLGMGTATGFARNRYFLAATATDASLMPAEGQCKVVAATATGEAYLDVGGTTSTGGFVFTTSNSWMILKLINGAWRPDGTGATLSTATNR